jgi:hypothetical protein
LVLVVVTDLDVMGVSIPPAEADPPLVVDSNAVLARTVPDQALQPVAGRHTEFLEPLGGIQQQQLAVSSPLNIRRQLAGALSFKNLPGLGISEGSNH